MADTTYTVSGSDINDLLGTLGERAEQIDYSRPLKSIAVYLASQAKQCFDQQQSPDGQPWTPLAASTIKRRRKGRKGGTPIPLRDTGVMMGSLAGQALGSVRDIQKAQLIYGTNLKSKTGFPYPSVHQFGSRTVPARPFLGITDSMKIRIREIV